VAVSAKHVRAAGEENGRSTLSSQGGFDRRSAADEFLEVVEWPWGEHKRRDALVGIRAITARAAGLLEVETGGAWRTRPDPRSITIFITAPNRERLERVFAAADRKRGRDSRAAWQASSRASWPASSLQSVTTVGASIDEFEGLSERNAPAA